ncbi:MAG: V-type ATPase subunit [Gemmatimonadota bacterium]
MNARAKGLAGHLLDEAAWRRVRTTPDLFTLCRELTRLGYPIEPGAGPRSAERTVEAVRQRRQAQILRWLGPRSRQLRFLLEAEDRRAIRTLLRGAAAGLPPEERRAAVPPACGLSERMVERVVRVATPEECLSELADLDQPLAAEALDEHPRLLTDWPEAPTLLGLELALVRAWAVRAVEGGKRGGPQLNRLLSLTLDLQNAWTALVLVSEPTPAPEVLFVEGGTALPLDVFRRTLEADEAPAVREILAGALPAPTSEPFADASVSLDRLERVALVVTLREQDEEALHEPLGPAPLLAFLLRLRLESRDLRGLLWARALGAPLELPEVV